MDRAAYINNTDTVLVALDQLAAAGRQFDVRDVVADLLKADGEIPRLTRSWLGDGDKAPISPVQVYRVFGRRRIDAFARKLGMERQEACDCLADVLPELVDNSSQHGRLLGPDNRRAFIPGLRFFRKAG